MWLSLLLCLCEMGFIGKWWASRQPKQALAQGGNAHYLSNCLQERATETDWGGKRTGYSLHLSFNSGTNITFDRDMELFLWMLLKLHEVNKYVTICRKNISVYLFISFYISFSVFILIIYDDIKVVMWYFVVLKLIHNAVCNIVWVIFMYH